jgi:hypothetical protein
MLALSLLSRPFLGRRVAAAVSKELTTSATQFLVPPRAPKLLNLRDEITAATAAKIEVLQARRGRLVIEIARRTDELCDTEVSIAAFESAHQILVAGVGERPKEPNEAERLAPMADRRVPRIERKRRS